MHTFDWFSVDSILRVPLVPCRLKPSPPPCAPPWWTADGAGTGALCVPAVDCRRRRHWRFVRTLLRPWTAMALIFSVLSPGREDGALCDGQ